MALVDPDDAPVVRSFKWSLHSKGYATAHERPPSRRVIYMHRLLLAPSPGMLVDHVDGDKLNNRRDNLRLATPRQNMQNQVRPARKRLFKGVYKPSTGRGWAAQISLPKSGPGPGRAVSLGRYETAEMAARAYDAAALQLYGEFAALNFPISEVK